MNSPDAHHRPGGGFQNPWPDAQLHGFKDFLKWRLSGEGPPRVPSPARDSLPRRESSIVAPRAASGYRSATWVGHSTVLLQLGPLNVLTDPVWSARASPFQWIGPRRLMSPGFPFDALPAIDLVLLSHNHYDHLDKRTIERIAVRFPDALWVAPLGVARLLRSFGVRNVEERDWWQCVETPAFTATCTPAQHFSGRSLRDRGDTLWCGWSLRTPDTNLFFAGDTALHPEFEKIGSLGPFDLVMLPIGAYEPRWFMGSVHMNPEDAALAYRALAGDTHPSCLPLHWGTFRLTDEPVTEPPIRFAAAWSELGLPRGANWDIVHGQTSVF